MPGRGAPGEGIGTVGSIYLSYIRGSDPLSALPIPSPVQDDALRDLKDISSGGPIRPKRGQPAVDITVNLPPDLFLGGPTEGAKLSATQARFRRSPLNESADMSCACLRITASLYTVDDL